MFNRGRELRFRHLIDPQNLSSRTDRRCEVIKNRHGVIILEFILVLPFLFFLTLAVFQFLILGLLIQVGTVATLEAAREGAKVFPSGLIFDSGSPDPTPNDDVADRISIASQAYLGLHGVVVLPSAPVNRSTAHVRIERDPLGGPAAATATRGNTTIPLVVTGPPPQDGELLLTISYLYVDAGSPNGYGNPLPNWLSAFGFSLLGSQARFQLTTRMALE